MDRSEFDGLRPLRREILLDVRTLRAIEKKEQAAKKSNRDLMHSMRVIVLEPDIEERKKKLIETIYDNQRRYLRKQSELEQMIADIDDQYARLVLSLYFVDLLSMKEIAKFIGGNCTARGVQALIARFFEKNNKEGGSGVRNNDHTGTERTPPH